LLSITKTSSFIPKASAKFVQVSTFKNDKSRISFSLFAGKISANQISSEAQIIHKLSTHLIAVFFITTGSPCQCQTTLAQILATATHCQTSRFEPQQTILNSLSSQTLTWQTLKASASGCFSILLIFQNTIFSNFSFSDNISSTSAVCIIKSSATF
jgi:hypothetical protein